MIALSKSDFRAAEPKTRRELFLRSYEFNLKHRAHPGAVYYTLPHLRKLRSLEDEEAVWLAFLYANTEHPVTTLLFLDVAPTLKHAPRLEAFFEKNYSKLDFDLDRGYQKRTFLATLSGYLSLIRAAGSQRRYIFDASLGGWHKLYQQALKIPYFGRMSAFSFLEYVNVLGLKIEPEGLDFRNKKGSRTIINGVCRVEALDKLDITKSEKESTKVRYGEAELSMFERTSARLLREARTRNRSLDFYEDINYFTLESSLCSFQSFFKKNRRYVNVYNDILYGWLKIAELKWGASLVEPFWEARQENLPARLRLEDSENDPGYVPVKKNWFYENGEMPILFQNNPQLRSDFDNKVSAGYFGKRVDKFFVPKLFEVSP